MNKTYKHVFFDLDHTLWDFDRNSYNTLERLYREYKLDEIGIPDLDIFVEKYNAHNNKLWDRFRKGFIKRDELRWKRFWLTLLDHQIGDTALAHELSMAYVEILPTQTLLTPHAKEVLEYCKEKYTLHLITNGYEMTQKIKMQFSGISPYFNEIITSEKSSSLKPKPEIFEYALGVTSAECDECIMIGDTLEVDVAGARNAGWDQVYYNPAKIAHNQKPTYEVACLSELLKIL